MKGVVFLLLEVGMKLVTLDMFDNEFDDEVGVEFTDEDIKNIIELMTHGLDDEEIATIYDAHPIAIRMMHRVVSCFNDRPTQH